MTAPRWPEGYVKAEQPTTRQGRRDKHDERAMVRREAMLAPLLAEAPKLPDPYTEYTRDGKVLLHPCRTHIDPKTPIGRRIALGYARFHGLAADDAIDAGQAVYRDFDEEFRHDAMVERARACARGLLTERALTSGEVERVAGLLTPYVHEAGHAAQEAAS